MEEYENLCKKWDEPVDILTHSSGRRNANPYGEHAKRVREMEECGTKDITPREHSHPTDESVTAFGIKLGGGARIRRTDLYSSPEGAWETCLSAYDGFDVPFNCSVAFVRPVKK